MPDRNAKIETADPELAATYELCQAMKRFYSRVSTVEKRRAVLHMALRYMAEDVEHNGDMIWLRLK
jgi:hypothetical protein